VGDPRVDQRRDARRWHQQDLHRLAVRGEVRPTHGVDRAHTEVELTICAEVLVRGGEEMVVLIIRAEEGDKQERESDAGCSRWSQESAG
jgi:hypothetical protein